MIIHYIIAAHNRPDRLDALIDALLLDPSARIYVHLDRRPVTPFELVHDNSERVTYVSKRLRVRWGTHVQVRATISLLHSALPHLGADDYVAYLSGDSFPLLHPRIIRARLIESDLHYDWINYVPMPSPAVGKPLKRVSHWHLPLSKRGGFEGAIARAFSALRIPRNYRPVFGDRQLYGGSSWWMLRGRSILEVLRTIDSDPRIVNFLRFTAMPDEFFFQTLVLNLTTVGPVRPSPMFTRFEPGATGASALSLRDVEALVNGSHSPALASDNVNVYLFARKVLDKSVERAIRRSWIVGQSNILE